MKQTKNKLMAVSASAFVFVMMPMVAFANTHTDGPAGRGIGNLIKQIGGWVADLIPIMMSLAVLAFFWGLAKWLFTDGAEGKGEGLKIMMYGILAVFVMASLGGIVAFLQRSTNTGQNTGVINAPCINDCPDR